MAARRVLYRTRDLIPAHLMPQLARGRVLVTNWHVFEPKSAQSAGQSAKVIRARREIRTRETIRIGARTTTARGTRNLTPEALERQAAIGLITVLDKQPDRQGKLKSVSVESVRYVESDTRLIERVLSREVGGKRNVLVMNDEAHHAYRIRRAEPDEGEEDLFGEADESEEFYREATVWIDGLDRIHKQRGINLCIDLSATPYFLGRVGQDANRPFPWVVSDFGLVDAIESGLVKIPQLAVRDTSGSSIPGYFNIWRWIQPRLTPVERGGRRGRVKPEAVLNYAHVPVAMLGGLWDLLRREWSEREGEPRPPVFIIVCNDTALAKVVYRWLAEDEAPVGIPPARLDGLRNADEDIRTIRVDSDAFLSPWYGWLVERLLGAIRPDDETGESGEAPCYETGRGPGSTAEVDFETRREPYPVMKSHVNAVVPDTAKWEQSAAYRLDTHDGVHSFVKNAGLGFAIPYLHNGEPHEYLPDFIVRLVGDEARYLILETKGYDPLAEVKSQAAHRWVRAVIGDGSFGSWDYALVSDVGRVGEAVNRAAKSAGAGTSAEGA